MHVTGILQEEMLVTESTPYLLGGSNEKITDGNTLSHRRRPLLSMITWNR